MVKPEICSKHIYMKKLLILSLLLAGTRLHAQRVFITKFSGQADVKIYEAKYESQADLKVYKVSFESQSRGNEGYWYFVEREGLSDLKITFTSESSADIKIYYVKYSSQAGWVNTSKKCLLD